MSGKVEQYRAELRNLPSAEWDAYMAAHSNLPGPRANLDLLHAAAEECAPQQAARWRALSPAQTAVDPPLELAACVGVVALGRFAAQGDSSAIDALRPPANDPRSRVRESAAMAFQRWGDADMDAALHVLEDWSAGTLLEQRCVVAAVCEPRLLVNEAHARAALALLDGITTRLAAFQERKRDDFRVLRQALAYGWSVAAVALPEVGLPMIERWLASPNPDARWLMRENLKKNRLLRLAPEWVAAHLK